MVTMEQCLLPLLLLDEDDLDENVEDELFCMLLHLLFLETSIVLERTVVMVVMLHILEALLMVLVEDEGDEVDEVD